MSGLNDIWHGGKGALSEETLLAYLEGKLSPEKQREIEQLLNEEGLESDAIEGLRELSPETAAHTVRKLNQRLQQFTHKTKRKTHNFSDNKWAWVAVILILLLSILAYSVLYLTGK